MPNPTLYMLPLSVIVQYLTNIGQIAAGATITTLVAGSVSTQQTTYADSSGLVANPNPMTLNSAARPSGASGALAAFWVLPGVVVDVYFVDTLGETWSIKNMAAINDPTLLGGELSNPASGFGADLIANAMRSYDVFSSLRAANVPVLTGNQTLIVDVEGALLVNDSGGGFFYWSATSTAADNGTTVIKPNALLSTQPGRYLRQASLLSGTGSLAMTGTAAAVAVNYSFRASNGIVALILSGATGTSNAGTMTLGTLPAGLAPLTLGAQLPCLLEDNGNPNLPGWLTINTAGVITYGLGTTPNFSGFTATGTKGIMGQTLVYPVI